MRASRKILNICNKVEITLTNLKKCDKLFGNFFSNSELCFGSTGTKMWCANHFRMAQKLSEKEWKVCKFKSYLNLIVIFCIYFWFLPHPIFFSVYSLVILAFWWLLHKHIKSCTSALARLEVPCQWLLINDTTPSNVNHSDTLLATTENIVVE